MRVLLTYDEPIVAALIEAVLRIDEIDVVLTHTAEDALQARTRQAFDLHVVDARLGLPDDEEVPTLRLADRENVSATGGTNELRLPFDAESLIRRVRLLSRETLHPQDGDAEGVELFPLAAGWTDEDGLLPLSRLQARPLAVPGPSRHRVFWYADRRR